MKIKEEELKNLGLKKTNETYIEIIITGDVNYGDEITSINKLNNLSEYIKLKNIVDKINKETKRSNWRNKTKYLNQEEINYISEYVPYGEEEPVHTIENVEFKIVVNGSIYN